MKFIPLAPSVLIKLFKTELFTSKVSYQRYQDHYFIYTHTIEKFVRDEMKRTQKNTLYSFTEWYNSMNTKLNEYKNSLSKDYMDLFPNTAPVFMKYRNRVNTSVDFRNLYFSHLSSELATDNLIDYKDSRTKGAKEDRATTFLNKSSMYCATLDAVTTFGNYDELIELIWKTRDYQLLTLKWEQSGIQNTELFKTLKSRTIIK